MVVSALETAVYVKCFVFVVDYLEATEGFLLVWFCFDTGRCWRWASQ
jgi:hypothetical protein